METRHQQLERAVQAALASKMENIYFVACGGSMALFLPAQYILDRELATPSFVYTANEFVHREPKGLGADSVVVLCSHSGTTPETVNAAKLAREKGAITIAFSNEVGSPLWEAAEYGIQYDWGPESDAAQSNVGMLFKLVFNILNAKAPNEKYERALNTITKLKDILTRNKEQHEEAAKAFGSAYKREPLIYAMASGSCYGPTYAFAACLLQEMQWVHSNAIHSGEYFHGPFEITDYDVPFVIVKGLDETRPLDERAEAFCKKFSERVVVIDAAEFDWTDVGEDLRKYFAYLIVNGLLRQYADWLAEHRGHPLSVRRYMWKMEY
ncbi:MAG: SIS domain-containing protein [Bacillota bacterium]|nr:SIS domain-containing protein [Bacillota bacterium]